LTDHPIAPGQQRRASTPSVIQSPLQGTPVPILTSTGKVIVAHIAGGNASPSVSTSASNSGQLFGHGSPSLPLIRPMQPGSPIIVRSSGPTTQLLVRKETCKSKIHLITT